MSDATLRTERLWLVPLDPAADAEDVHVAFADPEVMEFWDTPPWVDRAETVRQLKDSVAASGSHAWVVQDTRTGRCSAS